MPQIFACSELLNPNCRGLLSEYFFLKLLSFSERFVVWTPKSRVTVEVWLNRLNSAAWLWNLSNWAARRDGRLGFGLHWLRKFIPKRPYAFGTWIDHSLLALTAFKRKSWKRWKPRPVSSRALVPCCSPCPGCFSSLPGWPGRALLWSLEKQGFAWKVLSFLRESWLCTYAV